MPKKTQKLRDPNTLVRVSVFLHPATHTALWSKIIEDKKVSSRASLNQMFIEAMDLYLAMRGLPSGEELAVVYDAEHKSKSMDVITKVEET